MLQGGLQPNSTQAHEANATGELEESKQDDLAEKFGQMTMQSDASVASSQMSQGAQQALLNNPESADAAASNENQPTLIPGNKPLGQGGIAVRISDFIAYEMLG